MTNMMDLYQKKYCILKRKCEDLHQTNEKLVNRIHHVKRILKRYKHERRVLVEGLDQYNDELHDADVPPMCEDVTSVEGQEPGQSCSLAASLAPQEQESVATESPDMVTMETDTSPSLTSPSATTRAAPVCR